MRAKPVSDDEFVELWNKHRSAAKLAAVLNISERSVHSRRRNIELRRDIQLVSVDNRARKPDPENYQARHRLGIQNGVVIVFSDAHFWPGLRSTAFKGLLWAAKTLEPKAIINNGDAFDGASISRYPRIGWDNKPSVIQELRACEAALEEIQQAAPKAKLIWTVGNHDTRFESRLANNVPEFSGALGFKLADHFPAWTWCWSCWPTDDVIVKHRYKNGVHATHNNTVNSGVSIVTGHLHSLKVTPFADYTGNRFGVDTGTLADTNGPQFSDYLEDGPTNWRSGFAVLTFVDGALLWPELVHKFDEGRVEFRGSVIDVSAL